MKYAQRDSANEILRTEVLSRLAAADKSLFIVSYPEAVSELVVSRKKLDERTLELHVGENVDIEFIEETLRTFGFTQHDYVYFEYTIFPPLGFCSLLFLLCPLLLHLFLCLPVQVFHFVLLVYFLIL